MLGLPVQERVGEVEHALYGEQRAKEEAAKRAAAEERAAKRAAERQKVQKAKEWSDEEVRLLEKALDKFPQVPYFTSCNSIYMSGLLPFWNCEMLLIVYHRAGHGTRVVAARVPVVVISALGIGSDVRLVCCVRAGHSEEVGGGGGLCAHARSGRGAGHGQARPQGRPLRAQAGQFCRRQKAPGVRPFRLSSLLLLCPFRLYFASEGRRTGEQLEGVGEQMEDGGIDEGRCVRRATQQLRPVRRRGWRPSQTWTSTCRARQRLSSEGPPKPPLLLTATPPLRYHTCSLTHWRPSSRFGFALQ